MKPTPIIDMFSGTGELARAVADGLNEFTCFQSFSDNYGPARKYLKARFRNVEIRSDFRDQDVPEGSIVAIGAPCQYLSAAGKRAGAERGSGTRSSLIHEALDMAVAGGADLIVAENVPGGYRTYLELARWLTTEHGYRTTVSSGGAWEVGAPHHREKHHNGNGHGETVASVLARDLEDEKIRLFQTWENVTGAYTPPTGQTCQFMHWMMGLPYRGLDALGLSVSAQRRLAGNAVVRLQARLMLQRGLTAINNERTL